LPFAEGYERLKRARLGIPEVEEDIFADTTEDGPSTSSLLEMDHGLSAANTSATDAATNDDDSNFDMFGDNDDTDATRDSDVKTSDSGRNPDPVPQDASGTSGAESKLSQRFLFMLSKFIRSPFFINSLLYQSCI
jgi:CD2 antigen cytoplasmic tail-binding protein 2